MYMDFENWMYVYSRTPFGWKWATHTFLPYAQAIKAKVRKLERNGWEATDTRKDWIRMSIRAVMLQRQKEGAMFFDSAVALRDRWVMAMSFMYVDYLLAGSFRHLKKNRILADGVRTIGHLLLWYQSWSFSKAEEEGVFAHLHKYTGIVLNTSLSQEPRASFASDRIAKCLEIVRTVLDDVTAEECPIKCPIFFSIWSQEPAVVSKGVLSVQSLYASVSKTTHGHFDSGRCGDINFSQTRQRITKRRSQKVCER